MLELWWILLAAILLLAVFAWTWFPGHRVPQGAKLAEARRDFHRQREGLEAKFVQLGMAATRPDAPRWTDCDFQDDVSYARNRVTGELTAFVGVTIELEEQGGRPSAAGDAVRNLRAATAVFRFASRRWETDGRAIFNLTPAEAIRLYHRDLELVGRDAAERQ